MAGLGQHNILQEHKAWNLRRVLRAATIAKFAANVLIIRDILRHRRRKSRRISQLQLQHVTRIEPSIAGKGAAEGLYKKENYSAKSRFHR